MPDPVIARIPYSIDPNDDGEVTPRETKAIQAVSESLTAPTRGSGGNHDPAQVSRRTQAVTLAVAGMDWSKIAQVCGYTSGNAAQRAVQRALEHYEAPKVNEWRNLENARLDRQLAAIWPQVVEGNVPAGRLSLQIAERRARLNGLDKQPEATITPGAQEVAQWVQRVLQASGQGDLGVVEAEVIDVEVVEDDERTPDR